jgi:hypothetical protein
MPQLNGRITPMEDASAVSRDAGNPPVRFDVAGAGDGVMEPLNGHEAGNGGHSQGASCTPPRRSPTRLHTYSQVYLTYLVRHCEPPASLREDLYQLAGMSDAPCTPV